MPDEWANDAYLWLSAMCQAYVKAGGTEVEQRKLHLAILYPSDKLHSLMGEAAENLFEQCDDYAAQIVNYCLDPDRPHPDDDEED